MTDTPDLVVLNPLESLAGRLVQFRDDLAAGERRLFDTFLRQAAPSFDDVEGFAFDPTGGASAIARLASAVGASPAGLAAAFTRDPHPAGEGDPVV